MPRPLTAYASRVQGKQKRAAAVAAAAIEMVSILIQPQEPSSSNGRHFALWELGFRPFYLLAALFAFLSVPLWALQATGVVSGGLFKSSLWHAHEMVMGYALAIIVGFLFTAGKTWTGQQTPQHGLLKSMVFLWVLARVFALSPFLWVSMALNAAFPWASAYLFFKVLVKAQNKRNYFFCVLLFIIGLASVGAHLSAILRNYQASWGDFHLKLLSVLAQLNISTTLALNVVIVMIAVMAGRIVPMFTNNGIPGLKAQRKQGVEKLSIGAIVVVLVVDFFVLTPSWLKIVALAACLLANSYRFVLWQPYRTVVNPLVWVLHMAYAWLLLHWLLRIMALLQWIPESLAIHALTIGTLGGMTLGMITRTALGHTARPLKASKIETLAYFSIFSSAFVRVFMPMFFEKDWQVSIWMASFLWSAAFALYLWRYIPILLRPRRDGLPG